MYGQTGDVLFKRIDKLPRGTKTVKTDVVHKGQNHTHRVKGKFKIHALDGKKYLTALGTVKAVHEEHMDGVLPKGIYAIEIVNEYDHLLEESRKVVD